MKIALLVPSLNGGGAERAVANISLALPDEVQQDIIVFFDKAKTYSHKGTLIRMDTAIKSGIIAKCLNVLKRAKLLRELKNKNKYDAVISFMPGPNWVNILSGKSGKNSKTVISIRTYRKTKNIIDKKFRVFIYKIFSKKIDAIVAVSNKIKEQYIIDYKFNCQKVKTIYNLIDLDFIKGQLKQPQNIDLLTPFGSDTFVTVGRLCEAKGHAFLIKAFKVFVDRKKANAKLLIIGDGELEHELKKLVQESNMEGKIFLIGHQENPFIFMKQCRAFVLSSIREGFPNVILEAMACNLPIISSDCNSGPREILMDESQDKRIYDYEKERYGILTPDFILYEQRAIIEMSKALELMFYDDDLIKNYSIRSKERVQDFTKQKIIEQWLDIVKTQQR